MAIEGPIKELSLFELFQLISFSKKTGILKVTDESQQEYKLYFRDGNLSYMDVDNTLREEFIKRDIIKEDEAGKKDLIPFVLSEKRILPREVNAFLKNIVANNVYKLLKLSDGYFSFIETDFDVPGRIDLGLKAENLIMEGARRLDEITRMEKAISPESRLSLSKGIEKKPYIHLEPQEWRIMSYIDGNRTVRDIINLTGDEFTTIKILYGLLMSGIVVKKKEEERKQITEESRNSTDNDNIISQINTLWKENRYPEGVEYLSELMEEHPTDPTILYNLGFFYTMSGNLYNAISIWNNFIAISKDEKIKAEIREILNILKELSKRLIKREVNIG